MLTYIGNGPYCYANSASMLLESAGEYIEPRLIEVLSGVGLGACWLPESQTLFLSGWTVPDIGVSQSLRLLGFEVAEEAESDGAPMPVEALDLQLIEGPVMLGPLDLGELSYHPNGSTFLEISKSNFREMPITAPAEATMRAFDEQVRRLYERIVSNERERHALQTQRETLLPKLVSGELRVGDNNEQRGL